VEERNFKKGLILNLNGKASTTASTTQVFLFLSTMERTKKGSSNNKVIIYEQNQEPIVYSKALFDILLSTGCFTELLALYSFYYYTAKWQNTSQPWATTRFVAIGLNWGIEKVRKYKGILKDLGLIEDIQIRNTDSKQIIKHYVKIKFVWDNIHPSGFASAGESPPVEKSAPNALRRNNINAKKKEKEENACVFLDLFPNSLKKDESFQEAISNFIQHRIDKKAKLTQRACDLLAKKLLKFTSDEIIDAIEESISSGWTGIFPKHKKDNYQNSKGYSTYEDRGIADKFKK
jgi:hypothetical protein